MKSGILAHGLSDQVFKYSVLFLPPLNDKIQCFEGDSRREKFTIILN